MSLMLATTWDPRGELSRFARLMPQFKEVYSGLVMVVPPAVHQPVMRTLNEIAGREWHAHRNGMVVLESSDWSAGRYLAVKMAVNQEPAFVQYADCDRLLRWVETHPTEWRQVAERSQHSECLIVGRTPAAYATHPQALIKTEAISNYIVSHWLGRIMDVSAGVKSFSLEAAHFLAQYTSPGKAFGTDAEWPILLQRAGFQVDYLEVDGLEWESADRFRDQAADRVSQREVAHAYDADPENWAYRTAVTLEIVQAGLEAARRKLPLRGGLP